MKAYFIRICQGTLWTGMAYLYQILVTYPFKSFFSDLMEGKLNPQTLFLLMLD